MLCLPEESRKLLTEALHPQAGSEAELSGSDAQAVSVAAVSWGELLETEGGLVLALQHLTLAAVAGGFL